MSTIPVLRERSFFETLRLLGTGMGVMGAVSHASAEPGGTASSEAERSRARELMRAGNELYGEGKLSEAYAKYLEAWRTAQAFDIACNLGGTASELSMNRDAAEYLDYCLRHYPASSRPESVATEQRARAAFEVVKTKVAAVNVRVTPVGAEVYVDGTIAGRAPLDAPVFLEAGPHRIEARYAGLESASVDVNAKRDIWMRSPHHPDPFEEERLPQTDLASHGQHGTVTFGYGHLLPCSLPQLNESRRET